MLTLRDGITTLASQMHELPSRGTQLVAPGCGFDNLSLRSVRRVEANLDE